MRWLTIGFVVVVGACLASGCTGTLNVADTKYHVESVPPGMFSADLDVKGLDARWNVDPLAGLGKAISGIKNVIVPPPDGG